MSFYLNTKRKMLSEVEKIYEEHNLTLLEIRYINAKETMFSRCNTCQHCWFINLSNVMSGKHCPKCSRNKNNMGIQAKENHNFSNSFPELSKDWDYEKNINTPFQVTPHSGKKVWWKCPLCKRGYSCTPNNRSNGKGCPYCTTSKGEMKIAKFLEENNILFISHRGMEGCKDQKKLPFDFYLPDHNLCIEFQGMQHFIPFAFRKSTQKESLAAFDYVKRHDEIKKNFCIANNIDFLEICYFEFREIENILRKKLMPS